MVTLTSTSSTENSVTIDLPIRPYKVLWKMATDISRNEQGQYDGFDNGIDYDSVSCDCTFILPYAQAYALNAFLRAYRSESYQLTIDPEGFYPFLPHMGNQGPFLIACQIKKMPGQVAEPWLFFEFQLVFTSVYGYSWPAPSSPTAVSEGDLSITGMHTIGSLPCPKELFPVEQEIATSVVFDEKTNPYYSARPATSDQAIMTLSLNLHTNNAFLLFQELIYYIRVSQFTLNAASQGYFFGEHYGNGVNFTVMNLSNSLQVTHEELNLWSTKIKLWKAA